MAGETAFMRSFRSLVAAAVALFGMRAKGPHLARLIAGALALVGLPSRLCAGSEPKHYLEMSDDATRVTLVNSMLRLVFDKKSGSLESLDYGGRQLLAKGGGYVQIAYTSRRDNPRVAWSFRVVRRETELIEIAFVNTSAECPFDFESHYLLRAGDPGFYHYLVWGHDTRRNPIDQKLAQFNFALRVDKDLFTTAAVDDQRIARFPPAELLSEDRLVMDATYRLPDGGYYSKYFFAAEMDERHAVHGAMSDTGLGIWMILPSHEHLNGGPEHQELTVSQGGASQVLLAHAQGAHYGAGILSSNAKDGSWRKVSAPWFVYVNEAENQAALWEDAKHRAAQEVAAWPHHWLDDASFQLNRGRVVGRLVSDDKRPVAGARIILADHDEEPGPLLWQQQWRGYRFYGSTDQDGRFEIGKVRPGLYDLYAWRPGSFGHFIHRGVQVGAGTRVNIGEQPWDQPHGREQLWQIGMPDHSAKEFGFAENFRQWGLWQQIADATSNGVIFVAGKSRDREWPFQMAITQNADLSWRVPQWHIQFKNDAERSGQAVLTMGIAAYEGSQKPQLTVSLNGEIIVSITDLEISGASHRSGIHAGYQEREILVDAAKLRIGTNTLTIEMPSPGKPAGKSRNTPSRSLLWDCLRMELSK